MQIIYIMGEGRSGSTLLDIILGQSKEVINLGEIKYFLWEVENKNHKCSCAKSLKQCEFWSKVLKEFEKESKISIDKYISIQKDIERIRTVIQVMKNPSLIKQEKFQTYLYHTKILYELIFKFSNKKIIVDSSKDFRRLYFLQFLDFDIKVIHNIRDVRGVCFSYNKKLKNVSSRKVSKTAIAWLLENFFSMIMRKKFKGIKVRYEEVVNKPEALKNLIDFLELKDKDFIYNIKNGLCLKNMHICFGSRIRMKSKIYLAYDIEWMNKFSFKEKYILGFINKL